MSVRDWGWELSDFGISPDDDAAEPIEWRPAEPDDDTPRKGEGEVIPFADEWLEEEDANQDS